MAMLRVVSSKVVPRAVGAIFLERALLGSITNTFNGCDHHGYKVAAHHLNTSCYDAESRLVRLLNSKIKVQKIFVDGGMPSAPSHFPFAVKDDTNKLTLTRDFNGEKIQVVVAMLDYMPEEEFDFNISSYDDDDGNDKEPLSLTVSVSKENGKNMKFNVSASADEITVNFFSVQEPVAKSDEMLASTRHYVEEEGDLQVALGEFLKIRGIDKDYYEFLYKYMARKRRIGPLVAMTKLRNFIMEK